MHIAGSENMNQKADKTSQSKRKSRKPINAKPKSARNRRPESTSTNVKHRLIGNNAPACGRPNTECNHKRQTVDMPMVRRRRAAKKLVFIFLPNSQLINRAMSGAKIIRLKKLSQSLSFIRSNSTSFQPCFSKPRCSKNSWHNGFGKLPKH